MSTKKKIRRLKHLLSQHFMHSQFFQSWKKSILEDDSNHSKVLERKEIFRLAEELGINDNNLAIMWEENWSRHNKQSQEYRKRPQKEGRDNKDIPVGGGGSNRCMIRYPSKKRNLYTWKKFYKLFPYAAERDEWDGKTSKKMK